LIAPQPRLVRGPGYEWALSLEQRAELNRAVVEHWGVSTSSNPWSVLVGSSERDQGLVGRYQRLSMSPGEAMATMQLAGETDVRELLASVQCPTLVLRRAGDEFIDSRHSRYVAERIPGARYLELGGEGHVWDWDPSGAARAVGEFLTGSSPPRPSERVLATVLFSDIVGSTERAGELGDAAWRALLERHDELVDRQVGLHRGRVVKSLGDGMLAVFDGPSRAIGCAVAIRDGARALGLRVRAGLHTGECEMRPEGDVAGMAVHIGARIAGLAGSGQILTSSTVRDLTVGSPFDLLDQGERALKGVAEPWRVFLVGS
jgi:class 3 adenylate cyclase